MPIGVYKHKKHTKERIEKIRIANTGKKHTEERKEKIGNALRGKYTGEKSSSWKGDNRITPLTQQIRHCFQYQQWRCNIYERDDYTCQLCNKRGGSLEAHHYRKGFAQIIKDNNIKTIEEAIVCEELWNINNGMTLCKKCHNLFK